MFVGFRRGKNLARECIPELCGIAARWQRDASILPDLAPYRRPVDVAQQTGHETGNNHKCARIFTLPEERYNMTGLGALNLQRKIFTSVKNVCLPCAQA